MLILIVGPMGSGKTQMLIDYYNEYLQDGKKCLMFKPKMDTRFSETEVTSRTGNKVKAIEINKWEDISRYGYLADNLFIDEGQFIGGSIKPLIDINDTYFTSKHIFVSGLQLTTTKEVFGNMGMLLANADIIKNLSTDCQICGKKGIGKYAYSHDNTQGGIVLGSDNYKTICPECYKKLNNKEVVY